MNMQAQLQAALDAATYAPTIDDTSPVAVEPWYTEHGCRLQRLTTRRPHGSMYLRLYRNPSRRPCRSNRWPRKPCS